MPKYTKKPVEVEAMPWDGSHEGAIAIIDWVARGGGVARYHRLFEAEGTDETETLNFVIVTLEGEMVVSPGDYVIQGVHGEFYPCKPDIFAATYDPAPPDPDEPAPPVDPEPAVPDLPSDEPPTPGPPVEPGPPDDTPGPPG
jgi:hypothetical protein